MEHQICHSYQVLAEDLLHKFAVKDSMISDMLAHMDLPAMKAYAKKIKDHCREKIPLPYELCPLNPQITGDFIFSEYKLTKVILQSMPGHFIPVHLYTPLNPEGKHPALEVPMGHHLEGKCLPDNQIMCANLAMQGFVVATFDPVGQGERDLFPGMIRDEKQTEYAAVDEHVHVALPLNMLGENLTSFFMWDCVRVIDYICSLPFVDLNRIGVTGQSGGGAQSTFLGVLDDRVSAVSPIQSSGKTAFYIRHNIGDSEQTVNGLCEAFGVEHTDMLWAIWPKKLMLNCDNQDAPLPSLRYVEQELSRVYEIAGQPEDFSLEIADCGHEISKQTREIAYTWFGKIFRNTAGPIAEKEVTVLSADQLRCFPRGLIARNDFDITKRRLALARERGASDTRPLLEKVKEVLQGYSDTYTVDLLADQGGRKEFIVHTRRNDYIFCRLITRDSDRLRVIVDSAGVIPLLGDTGEESLSSELVLLPFGGYFTGVKAKFDYDIDTITAFAGFFSGKNMFRRRLVQILTALSYVHTLMGDKTIDLAGSGQGGLLALCAALYCRAASVKTERCLGSFLGYFENINYVLEETTIIPGLVNLCDIPDLAELTGIPVTFVNPLDEGKRIMDKEAAARVFAGKAMVEWA